MKKVAFLILTLLLISVNVFSQYLFTMDISANKIKYDLKRDIIYAIVSGSDANYANSLVAIDPYNGSVVNNIFIGSEPTDFVFTTDSNFLYFAFDGQAVIKKFDINKFEIAGEINLGSDPYNGTLYANSLAVLPDNDSTIIVSLKAKSVSPSYSGVVAYSNNTKLPKELPTFMFSATNIDYLLSTGKDTIYGYDASSSANDFYIICANPDSGVSLVSKHRDFAYLDKAKYENGLIFDDNGLAINPKIPTQLGNFSLGDTWNTYAHQSDSEKNKVFFCKVNDNNTDLDFFSYNRTTFSKESSYCIPNIISSDFEFPEASQLIRFGAKGLAAVIYDYYFSDKGSSICILNNSSFVDSIAPIDTSELAQLYILDTVYTYEHITVFDTLDVYNYVTIYDTTHLSTTDTLIVFQTTTNVNGNIIKSEISLYPNPASNYINFEISNSNVIENYNIKLYNTLGELFFDSQLTSDLLTIDISSYSKGTYILTLTNNLGQRIATKYVVVK